ncbi:nuclear envelope integral membrane protein 1a-like isoform X1 [Carcharodon carcharias]|uniref:nuclear envelope integral membrane protein 1a-like isoform X1 n=2 Tax=Carcharodon carcharias TaxID=13397 RepID=UPI001B7E42B7|nr:nuclear envelope integral membrane protein 1a-like isoform X1 [Carcharodon carcharias]
MWRRHGSALAVLLCASVAQLQALVKRAAAMPSEMLHEGEVYHETTTKLFFYEFSQKPKFVDYWSAVKVKINSSELLELTYPSEEDSFNEPETVIDFIKHLYYQVISSSKSSASEFNISIECYDRKICFKVKPTTPSTKYIVTVTRQSFEPKLIFLFGAGIILFLCARHISRSEQFYYCAGVTLGIFATLVLILLACRRLLQKRTFLLLIIPSWSASAFLIYFSIVNLSQYRKYLFGYLFVVGCLSYAVCYRHGPLSDKRSINLLTWTLQLVASLLIYRGVTCSQCAYTVIVILLCVSNVHHPVNLIHYIYRKIKQVIKKPRVYFLTEDEYKEQTEMATIKALEELRRYCKGQSFPTWEIVSKVSSPKRLADFILGAHHLTQEEVQNHEEQYGIGGSFLEAQLFATEEINDSALENGVVMAADEEHEVDEIIN